MDFDLNKPAWPPGDPRFENIKNIMLSVDGVALLELLEEYKRIAILELPELIRSDKQRVDGPRIIGRIDFIDDLIALLSETIASNDEEVVDGG